jgi:DNA-binding transcriptional regulator LsrR (DeoR family)
MTNSIMDEEQLVSRVAWLYYHEDLTQAEIGERLGLTRLKVNRLLQSGREQGLVQVVINTPFKECVALEGELVRRFGLARAIVVPAPEKSERLYDAIGRPAGEYVSTILRDGQSLGLGWGNTIRAAINGVIRRNYQDISVVSLYGGVPQSPVNPFDSTAMFARKFLAKLCHHVAAPMFVSSPRVRETIAELEPFSLYYNDAAHVDVILTAVGDMSPKATNLTLRGVDQSRWENLLEAGAVGEFFGQFLDSSGLPLDHEVNRCSMSADFATLCRAGHIVLVSGGLAKTPVLKAVLNRRYAHVFVTDSVTAANLLS